MRLCPGWWRQTPFGIHFLSAERKRNFASEPLIMRIYSTRAGTHNPPHGVDQPISLLWFILLSAFGHIESREAVLQHEQLVSGADGGAA